MSALGAGGAIAAADADASAEAGADSAGALAGAADSGAAEAGALELPELEQAPSTNIAAIAMAPRRFGVVVLTSMDPPGVGDVVALFDVVTVGGRGQRAVCGPLRLR